MRLEDVDLLGPPTPRKFKKGDRVRPIRYPEEWYARMLPMRDLVGRVLTVIADQRKDSGGNPDFVRTDTYDWPADALELVE